MKQMLQQVVNELLHEGGHVVQSSAGAAIGRLMLCCSSTSSAAACFSAVRAVLQPCVALQDPAVLRVYAAFDELVFEHMVCSTAY